MPSGAAAEPQWVHMEAMSFLEKNEYHGQTISNVDKSGRFKTTLDLDLDLPEDRGSPAGSQRSHSQASSQASSAGSGRSQPSAKRSRRDEDDQSRISRILESYSTSCQASHRHSVSSTVSQL
ncbi:hypothetical protein OSTOST_18170 [Ostertagia ostertagi]